MAQDPDQLWCVPANELPQSEAESDSDCDCSDCMWKYEQYVQDDDAELWFSPPSPIPSEEQLGDQQFEQLYHWRRDVLHEEKEFSKSLSAQIPCPELDHIPDPAPEPPRWLYVERYTYPGRVLGQGDQTSVLEARREDQDPRDYTAKDNRSYAMKKISCTNSEDFLQQKQKLANEIQIMKKLKNSSHPARNRVTQFVRALVDERSRTLCLVLSPVAEMSLRQVFDHNKALPNRSSPKYQHMLRDLAEGLSYIHSCTIRHKDIKPENVLLYKGRLLYADFGISREFSCNLLTTEGSTIDGTFVYASPEVVDGKPRNAASDVFCLGAVFYEILAHIANIESLQDTCWGGDKFRGYAKMAEEKGPLQRSILLAQKPHNESRCNEHTLNEYLRLVGRMLSEAQSLRPRAESLVRAVKQIQSTSEPQPLCRHTPPAWTAPMEVIEDKAGYYEHTVLIVLVSSVLVVCAAVCIAHYKGAVALQWYST